MLLFFVAAEYNWRVRIPLVFCRRRIQLAGSNPTCILSSPNTTGGFESHLFFVVVEYNWRVRIPLPTHTHTVRRPALRCLPSPVTHRHTHNKNRASLSLLVHRVHCFSPHGREARRAAYWWQVAPKGWTGIWDPWPGATLW